VLLLLEQVGQVALLLLGVAVEHGPGDLEVEVGEVVANSAAVAAAEGLLAVAVADVAVAGNVGVHEAEAVSNPE
jgi:hypothetical protein